MKDRVSVRERGRPEVFHGAITVQIREMPAVAKVYLIDLNHWIRKQKLKRKNLNDILHTANPDMREYCTRM